jgi:hypothetical protein
VIDAIDADSLGIMNMGEQHLSSQLEESGDAGSMGSGLSFEVMNNGPSEITHKITDIDPMEKSPETVGHMPNKKGLDGLIKPAGNSVGRIVKRTIDDRAESDDRPTQYGILFLYNNQII